MILLIDNYDSFTFNLKRYLEQLGLDVIVLRNDEPELHTDDLRLYEALVLSPGPKRPEDAGHCLHVVKQYSGQLPILGVCLGHQAICQAFGGRTERALRPVHGRRTQMHLGDSSLFEDIDSGTAFARYHSLIASREGFPSCLKIIATSTEDEIMAVQHIDHPTFGVQFHPESILSTAGMQILSNFARLAGLDVRPHDVPHDLLHPDQVEPPQPNNDLHETPTEAIATHPVAPFQNR